MCSGHSEKQGGVLYPASNHYLHSHSTASLRSTSSVRHGPRKLFHAVSSQPQLQRRSLLLTARPWEKRHGRLHPEAQTATLRPFPSLLLTSFSPSLSLIGYSLFVSLTFLDLLNCREWRMDVPFKDVVFDTADPHGSALSLRPLLFPDRKIDEMRVSALTQGTTNGVSIASYRPVLYQVHGTFSLKSKIGSFTRLPSMQARQMQC